MKQPNARGGTSNWTAIKRWCSGHILPLFCFLPLLVSCIMVLTIIDWSDFHRVLSDMWKADAGANWVQEALVNYSDILVAVIASILVALLSITITMYVFSKSALDRIIDENPYITSVARIFQDRTSDKLRWTTLCSVFPLLLVLGWYSILRFQPVVFETDYHRLIIGVGAFLLSFLLAMVITFFFWKSCLGVSKSLARLIQEKMKEYAERIQALVPNRDSNQLLIGYWSEWETGSMDDLIAKHGGQFPQCERGQAEAQGIKKIWDAGQTLCKDLTVDQYINLFSRIEILLMSGVGGIRAGTLQEYNESDIITVIQERAEISTPTIGVETTDLDNKAYRNKDNRDGRVLDFISGFRSKLGYPLDEADERQTQIKRLAFFQDTKNLYLTLKAYRDLLISERYVGVRAHAVIEDHAKQNELDDLMGLGMYVFFLRVLGLFVSAVTIKDYTFNGNVLNFANFYNSTLTDVSFYAAQFYHTIFARTKLRNVTMDLSEIDHVFFYYTNLSGTSMSNAKFSFADFENVQIQDCDLSICVFKDCRVSSSRLTKTVFNGSRFSNSQLEASDFSFSKFWNITWKATVLSDCDFTGAEIQNWEWPDRDQSPIQIKNCVFRSSVWENMSITCADISNAVFDEASMIGICFRSVNLDESLFRNCQLAQAEFVCCQNTQNAFHDANLFGASFLNCNLEKASLFRANASYAKFDGCTIDNGDCAEAYFRSAALRGNSFQRTRFYNATFDWAIIEQCDFRFALLDHVQFTALKCRKSRFPYASMTDSTFSGSRFETCDFTGADLSDSTATHLTMQQCRLRQTDFSRTKFVDCVFTGPANQIQSCTFSGSQFLSAGEGRFADLTFVNCAFDETQFSEWKLSNVTFQNCRFHGSAFSMCQFEAVLFSNCYSGREGNEPLTGEIFSRDHLLASNQRSKEMNGISFIA